MGAKGKDGNKGKRGRKEWKARNGEYKWPVGGVEMEMGRRMKVNGVGEEKRRQRWTDIKGVDNKYRKSGTKS